MILLLPNIQNSDSESDDELGGDLVYQLDEPGDSESENEEENPGDDSDEYMQEPSDEDYDSDLLNDVEEVIDYKKDESGEKPLPEPQAGPSKEKSEEEQEKENDEDKLLINDSDTEEATFEEMFGTKTTIQTRRYHPPPIELGVPATDLSFHPKFYKLATADLNGEICLFDIVKKTTTKVATMSHHKRSVRQICFNESGSHLFSASRDKSWAYVDIATSQPVIHVKKSHEDAIMSLYPLTENTIATGDDLGVVKFWDLRRKQSYYSLKCGDETINSLITADEDDRYLGVAVADGSITAIDIRKQTCYSQSQIYNMDFTCMALMNRDRKLYVGTSTGLMCIFKWGQFEKKESNFTGHRAGINSMLPLSENIFLIGSEDGTIRLVNTKPHDQFKGIIGRHPRLSIESMDVSADGNRLASCDDDGTVRFWDINFLKRREFFTSKKMRDRKLHLQSSRETNQKDFYRDLMAPPTFEEDKTPAPKFTYDSD